MSREWLDRVRRACASRGLPRPAVDRLVTELGEHLADLAESGQEHSDQAALCLGTPEELADSARQNLLAASFAARHPVLTFVILPIPLTLLGWTVMLMAIIGLFKIADHLPWIGPGIQHRPSPQWPVAILWLVWLLEMCVRVLPPLGATILCCRSAERAIRGLRWNMVACLLIALLFGLLFSRLDLPVGSAGGRWAMGFGLPGGREQLLQLLLPPALLLWWTCRRRADSSRLRLSE